MRRIRIGAGLSLLGISLCSLCFTGQPAMAQSVKPKNLDRSSPKEVRLGSISTQAQDLNNASMPVTPVWQLSQRKLDLEQFCRDYPYNSRCEGINPNNESTEIQIERSPAEIPSKTNAATASKSGWAIAPEASTLGLGGQIIRRISPNFNARVGVNAFGLNIDINETEFDYEGDLNLFNVSTLLDIHPSKNSGFRFSGGLIIGDNNVEGTADVSDRVADELGEVEVNGQEIDIRNLNIENLATIDADIEINNSVSPYLGIGGGNPVSGGKGLGFWWNLGVVFSSSPEAEVTSNISSDVPEELQEEVEAAADNALEDEERDLEDELDFLRIYPVVSLGLSYQF